VCYKYIYINCFKWPYTLVICVCIYLNGTPHVINDIIETEFESLDVHISSSIRPFLANVFNANVRFAESASRRINTHAAARLTHFVIPSTDGPYEKKQKTKQNTNSFKRTRKKWVKIFLRRETTRVKQKRTVIATVVFI